MMIKQITLSFTFFLVVGLAHARGDVLLTPKYSNVRWFNNVYTIAGNTITFKDGYQEAYGFEAGYLFKFGLAVTGEIGGYTLDAIHETAGSMRGYADIQWTTAMATQYFWREQLVQPYVGAGLGGIVIETNGSNTNVKLTGHISIARAGLLLAFSEHININFEYRYFSFEADDVYNHEMKGEGDYRGIGLVVRF